MTKFPGKTVEVDYTEHPKIDLKDRKILSVFSKNCRLTPTQIGKQVGLSKEVVNYRIKNLEKKGIIRGYISVLNPAKIGFQMSIVYLQTQSMSKEKENELIHKLIEHPNTHYIIRCIGKYDIAFDIVSSSINEFDMILRSILNEFGKSIKHYETCIILDVLSYNHLVESFSKDIDIKHIKFISDSSFMKDLEHLKIDYTAGKYALDDNDLRILYLLSNNSILQLKQLAHLIGISADTIKYRIKKLISHNIILGFQPIINISLLGYHTYLVLIELNNISFEEKNKILKHLAIHEDVMFCIKTSNQYEITLNASIKSNLHLHQFINDLKQNYPEQIKTIEMFLVIKDYKIAFLSKV